MPRKKIAPETAPAIENDRKARPLLGDDSWVTALVVDATLTGTRAGEPRMTLQLETTTPRLYAGRTLYFSFQPSLDKTLAQLNEFFPNVSWFDEAKVWDAIGGKHVRAHVYIEEARDDGAGNSYPARNRVASIYPSKKD